MTIGAEKTTTTRIHVEQPLNDTCAWTPNRVLLGILVMVLVGDLCWGSMWGVLFGDLCWGFLVGLFVWDLGWES